MTRKIYDLAVKIGSYTDRAGETKGRWENVGSVLQMEDGGKMILLKRSFNPAGVPFKEGSDQIAISMFPPKTDSSSSAGDYYQGAAKAQTQPAAPSAPNDFDDDIAF